MSDVTEQWKIIPEFPTYEASDRGRIRNRKTGRIMKQTPDKDGYGRLCLRNRWGEAKRLGTHRLVAMAFLPPPSDPDLFVCHRDDVKTNNTPGNLYYGTHRENVEDRERNGLTPRGPDLISNAKLSGEQVDEIRLAYSKGESRKDLASRFGVTRENIGSIVQGRTWKHRPFPRPVG